MDWIRLEHFNDVVSFDDILLLPQYSAVRTRKDIQTDVYLYTRDKNVKYRLKVPFISSPMDTVTEEEMAYQMTKYGGLGIIHRYFSNIEDQCDVVRKFWQIIATRGEVVTDPIVGAAVGATGDYKERAVALVNSGVQVICVDVAHGHHVHMKEALKELTQTLPSYVHIMAGNVATPADRDWETSTQIT